MLVKLRQLKKKSQSLPHQWPTLFGVLLRQGQVASPDQPAKVCPLTSCFHKAVACHADLAQTKESGFVHLDGVKVRGHGGLRPDGLALQLPRAPIREPLGTLALL